MCFTFQQTTKNSYLLLLNLVMCDAFMSPTLKPDVKTTTVEVKHLTDLVTLNTLYSEKPSNISLSGRNLRISDYLKSSEYMVYVFLEKYFMYITSFPGLITNPLSIYVSLKMRPFTTSELHMFALGVHN